MSVYYINLGDQIAKSVAPFVDLYISETTPKALGDGWTVNYIPGFVPEFDSRTFPVVTPTGDASWANQENVVKTGHRPGAGGAKLLLKGDPNTGITVDIYSNGHSGRIVSWSLNSGTPASIETNTLTDTITLTGATDGNGEAILFYEDGGGANAGPYSNAVRITTVAGPSITIDAPMTPGGTSILTYSNFDAAPTGVVTATPLDGSGDPIVGFTPLTYTGTVTNTDTAGVHSGTVTVNWPALVDGETTLPFGANRVRLSITS